MRQIPIDGWLYVQECFRNLPMILALFLRLAATGQVRTNFRCRCLKIHITWVPAITFSVLFYLNDIDRDEKQVGDHFDKQIDVSLPPEVSS